MDLPVDLQPISLQMHIYKPKPKKKNKNQVKTLMCPFQIKEDIESIFSEKNRKQNCNNRQVSSLIALIVCVMTKSSMSIVYATNHSTE